MKLQKLFTWLGINLLVFALFIALGEFSAWVFMSQLPRLSAILRTGASGALERDARVLSPAYTDRTKARKIYEEFSLVDYHYEPYLVWTLKPSQGETINVDEKGHRKTCSTVKGNGKLFRIFLFGGSTMFGTGASDCETIPSYLAQVLGRTYPHANFEVVNFGISGHQSTQELYHLMKELRLGVKPDLVLFYDGVNDLYAGAFSPAIPGAHQNLESVIDRLDATPLARLIKTSMMYKFYSYSVGRVRRQFISANPTDLDPKINQSLQIYAANLHMLHLLSKEFGFQYRAYWQPMLLATQKPITEFEATILSANQQLQVLFKNAYSEMANFQKRLSSRNFTNLSGLFDGDPSPSEIYLDYAHTTPEGNRRIAQAIHDSLKPIYSANFLAE